MPKEAGSKSEKTTTSRARKPASRTAARPRRTTGASAKKKLDAALAATWESRYWTETYPPGVPKTYDYPVVPLTAFLDDSARNYPNAPALDFIENRTTYAELKQM